MDDIVVGESLLAVMSDHVPMIETRNGLGVERLPYLLHETLGKRKGRLAVHRTDSP